MENYQLRFKGDVLCKIGWYLIKMQQSLSKMQIDQIR